MKELYPSSAVLFRRHVLGRSPTAEPDPIHYKEGRSACPYSHKLYVKYSPEFPFLG